MFIPNSNCDDATVGTKLPLHPPILLSLLCHTLRKQAAFAMLSFAIFSHISLLRPVSASRRDLYTLLLTFMLGTVGYTEAGKLPSPWQGLVKGAIVLSYAFLAAWLHWPLLRLETVRHEPFQNPPIGPS
jgi:hypothetical protein